MFWQVVEFSLLWSFLAVGGVGQVACLGFLVREAVLVFWWVELEFFCRFQSCSLCFSFFCVLASSVSNFHPDTWGWWWVLFYTHLFSRLWGGRDAANK